MRKMFTKSKFKYILGRQSGFITDGISRSVFTAVKFVVNSIAIIELIRHRTKIDRKKLDYIIAGFSGRSQSETCSANEIRLMICCNNKTQTKRTRGMDSVMKLS